MKEREKEREVDGKYHARSGLLARNEIGFSVLLISCYGQHCPRLQARLARCQPRRIPISLVNEIIHYQAPQKHVQEMGYTPVRNIPEYFQNISVIPEYLYTSYSGIFRNNRGGYSGAFQRTDVGNQGKRSRMGMKCASLLS